MAIEFARFVSPFLFRWEPGGGGGQARGCQGKGQRQAGNLISDSNPF